MSDKIEKIETAAEDDSGLGKNCSRREFIGGLGSVALAGAFGGFRVGDCRYTRSPGATSRSTTRSARGARAAWRPAPWCTRGRSTFPWPGSRSSRTIWHHSRTTSRCTSAISATDAPCVAAVPDRRSRRRRGPWQRAERSTRRSASAARRASHRMSVHARQPPVPPADRRRGGGFGNRARGRAHHAEVRPMHELAVLEPDRRRRRQSSVRGRVPCRGDQVRH